MTEEYNEAIEKVKDWPEAVRWVSHAVDRESERLMRAGEANPERFKQAEALRTAWKRILQG
jgi:uncharacterized protein YoxC